MYFEFYDNETGEMALCYLNLWKSIITLLFGRDIAKHVPRKNIIKY